MKPENKDPYCCLDVYCVTAEGGVRLGKCGQELKELFVCN